MSQTWPEVCQFLGSFLYTRQLEYMCLYLHVVEARKTMESRRKEK